MRGVRGLGKVCCEIFMRVCTSHQISPFNFYWFSFMLNNSKICANGFFCTWGEKSRVGGGSRISQKRGDNLKGVTTYYFGHFYQKCLLKKLGE